MTYDPSALFNPTEEHKMIRDMVMRFTHEQIEPQAAEHDEHPSLNRELFQAVGDLGLLGITVPAEDGGAGMDALAATIVMHEFSKSDPGFALAYLAHTLLFVNNFYNCSNAEQRARYLPRVISGEWIAGMGMTEPEAGTDVLGMRTTAVRDGDDYVLNGRKTFITNGPEGFCFLVYAKLDGRLTSFVVDRDCPGFDNEAKTPKCGMRGSSMSDLVFEDCRVPARNLLGEEGGGITHMMRNLEIERLGLSAQSLGIADRCVEIMLQYAADRTAFGRSINEFGQIQKYIAESYAETEAVRTLVYHVAHQVSPTSRNRIGSDAAKLFAGPVGKRAADNAMQVLGGAGYTKEWPVERLWRDAKLLEIGGGTLESHQKNLTKDLTKLMVD